MRVCPKGIIGVNIKYASVAYLLRQKRTPGDSTGRGEGGISEGPLTFEAKLMLRVTRFCVETTRTDRHGRQLREVEAFYTHREAVAVVLSRHRKGLAVKFWEVRGEPTTGLWKRPVRLVAESPRPANVEALGPSRRA